jgi:EmrB/QacA subfamily drug resistance transporter
MTGSQRWWAVAALTLSTLAVGFDVTILNMALPAMAADLDASTLDLQWFVTAYTLVFAAGMIPAGMLGDRYGRRKLMVAALVVFGAASLACAYASSAAAFIGARAMLGLGAALIMPTALAMLPTMFSAEERRKAIGVVAGAGLLAYPIGPILGGWLLNEFWWGSVFLINVPVVVLALLAVTAWMPESRAEHARGIDVGGIVVSCLSLAVLSYGVIRAGADGWGDAYAIASMAGGALLLAVFVLWERLRQRRSANPLVDLTLFRSAGFNSGTLLGTVVTFTMFGVLFVMPQYYQAILGTDAMGSGLRLLPMVLGLLVGIPVSDRMARAAGAKVTAGAGFALLAAGMFVGATTDSGSGTALAAVWTAVYGFGLGLALPTAMDAALGSLAPESVGVGSGVNQAIRTVGGSLGAGILGSILNSQYRAHLDLPAGATGADQSVFGGLAVAARLRSAELAEAVRAAFVHALDVVLLVSGGLGLLGIVIAFAWLPRGRVGRREPGTAESQHEALV